MSTMGEEIRNKNEEEEHLRIKKSTETYRRGGRCEGHVGKVGAGERNRSRG